MPVMIQVCPDDGSGDPWVYGQPCTTEPFWFPVEQVNEIPGWPSSGGGSAPSLELTEQQVADLNSQVLLLFATAFVFRKLFDFLWTFKSGRNDA